MDTFVDGLITLIQYFMSVVVIALFCAIILGVLLVIVLSLYNVIRFLI
jgi:hypothetical protein